MIKMLAEHGVDFSKAKVGRTSSAFLQVRQMQTGKSEEDIIQSECKDLVKRAQFIMDALKESVKKAEEDKVMLHCFEIDCEYSFDDLEIAGKGLDGSYHDFVDKNIPELRPECGSNFYFNIMSRLLVPQLEKVHAEVLFKNIMDYRLDFLFDYVLAGNRPILYTALNADKQENAKKQFEEILVKWKAQNYSDDGDYHEIIIPTLLYGYGIMKPDTDKAWQLAEAAMAANESNVYDIDLMLTRYALANKDHDILCKLGKFLLTNENGDKEDGIIHLKTAIDMGSVTASQILNSGSDIFTLEEKIRKNANIEATANDITGVIDLKVKNDTEEAYGEALDYLNTLLKKGFGEGTRGYELKYSGKKKTYLPGILLPNVPVHAFFAKAIAYPALHDKIAEYATLAVRQYRWYRDLDGDASQPLLDELKDAGITVNHTPKTK